MGWWSLFGVHMASWVKTSSVPLGITTSLTGLPKHQGYGVLTHSHVLILSRETPKVWTCGFTLGTESLSIEVRQGKCMLFFSFLIKALINMLFGGMVVGLWIVLFVVFVRFSFLLSALFR